MSADRWTCCPQCKLDVEHNDAVMARKVAENYGKIPFEEWLAMPEQSALTTPRRIGGGTLREDYILGIKNGQFVIRYTAYCDVCHFEYTFEAGEEIPLDKK